MDEPTKLLTGFSGLIECRQQNCWSFPMQSSLKPGLGNWVDDDRFFNREQELRVFSERLSEGASVLLVAQRRIGKTSLMRETSRRLREKIIALHVDLEKAFSPEDAVVELGLATRPYEGIWQRVGGVFGAAMDSTLGKLESIQVTSVSVKLRSQLTQDNWKATGDRLFAALAAVAEKENKQVIVFFDEVPILISRILKGSDLVVTPARKEATDAFMSWLRDNVLRYKGRVSQVLTGSIGIEPILNEAGLSGTINAYSPFELKPWSEKIAVSCLLALAQNRTIPLGEDAAKRMIELLGSAIPHHVQMFFDHVYSSYLHADVKGPITPEFAEEVFRESMTGLRGHPELSHMEERLRIVLPAKQFSLALGLLTEAAVATSLSPAAATQICEDAIEVVEDRRPYLLNILNILEHDGYLVPDNGSYVFSSRLVRDWWKRRFGFGYKPILAGK